MKIALLCDRYPPRPHTGIGAFVQMLARGLQQRGHGVLVVEVGEAYSEKSDGGVPIFTLPRTRLRWLGNLITRLRLWQWLAAQVRAGVIELIEAPDYPGFLPFAVPGCATVVRLHQSSTVSHRLAGLKMSHGIRFYEKRTLAAHPNWIGVSSHILDLTQRAFGVSAKRFALIHNGIVPLPAGGEEPPGLPGRFVLYAGQVSRRKGSLVLAEAAREFLPRHRDVHLVYAGGCLPEAGVKPIEQAIRQTVGCELAGHVHFLGQLTREQTVSCMRRAAVFAFPALIDCFPLVVLEAMSAGVPVVFTRNSPGPEMIEDGVSGLLADPACARDFAEKISRLLSDREFADRLAARACKRVAERFSLEQCVSATERFYEECLQDVPQHAASYCSSPPTAVPQHH
ncbi:MAG: glycosyltransferase family 4 protein [Chlamydiota bacterium]